MGVGLGSSIVDNVFSEVSVFPFPLVNVFRSNKQGIIVLQITTLSGLSYFIFHKFIQVVFPSLGWSSCIPLSSCRDDESCVPLGSSTGPSFLWPFGELGAISISSVSRPNLGWCMSAF